MEQIIETFHLDIKLLLAQAINFAIVFAVLYYFVIKPLTKVMAERSRKIEKSLEDAEKVEKRLEQTEEEYNKKILEAIKNLIWGSENFFRILEVPFENYEEISKILFQYISPKKLLSFVDASLIFSAKILKYDQIISFDGHFDGILTRIFLS